MPGRRRDGWLPLTSTRKARRKRTGRCPCSSPAGAIRGFDSYRAEIRVALVKAHIAAGALDRAAATADQIGHEPQRARAIALLAGAHAAANNDQKAFAQVERLKAPLAKFAALQSVFQSQLGRRQDRAAAKTTMLAALRIADAEAANFSTRSAEMRVRSVRMLAEFGQFEDALSAFRGTMRIKRTNDPVTGIHSVDPGVVDLLVIAEAGRHPILTSAVRAVATGVARDDLRQVLSESIELMRPFVRSTAIRLALYDLAAVSVAYGFADLALRVIEAAVGAADGPSHAFFEIVARMPVEMRC